MSSPTVDITGLALAGAANGGERVLARDESRYASGSHKEPSAHAVVAAAAAKGHDHVVVTSCGNYGRAMAVAARAAGLRCTVLLPAVGNDGGTGARRLGATTILFDGTYEEAHDETPQFAARLGAVDGNVDGPFAAAVLDGGGDVVAELHAELGTPPATFWVPVGNGTTLTAIGSRAAALGWPTVLHGVSCAGANPIATSWPGEYTPLAPEELVTTEVNLPLASWHSLHGPEAIATLRRTGGRAHGVSDDQMVAAARALALHQLHPTPGGAIALAGLLAHAASEPLGPGTHVVLVGGRDILDHSQEDNP
jgi:threonine synthase